MTTTRVRFTTVAATLTIAAAAAALRAHAEEPLVRPWKPAGISSPLFESHPAFDPKTGDLYFVRSSREFKGWHLLVSHCGASGWSEPAPPSFAASGRLEADPWFTPDGRTLYFISNRAVSGKTGDDLDIWKVERDATGAWAKPARLPEPVSSPGAEWFPRLGADGWLYFGSDRPGGFGKTDIWRARAGAKDGWKVENLGPAVNGAADEYEALPSPDGSRLIVMGSDGYFESRATASGWAPRAKLGPELNENGTEIGAAFSPSGRSLLFARDTKGADSGELFVWYPDGVEAWPPSCPADPSSGPKPNDTGFELKAIDEFHAFLARHDDDVREQHRFELKPRDGADAIAALEKKLGFAAPVDLRRLWSSTGAPRNPAFADAWQTLTIDSAAEMVRHPVGLLQFIDHAWGGRPELARWFGPDAAAKLNAEVVVFGYRYVDDDVHDYLFFDREGRFGSVSFDQDDLAASRAALDATAAGQGRRGSLDQLLRAQLDSIRESIEEETG